MDLKPQEPSVLFPSYMIIDRSFKVMFDFFLFPEKNSILFLKGGLAACN